MRSYFAQQFSGFTVLAFNNIYVIHMCRPGMQLRDKLICCLALAYGIFHVSLWAQNQNKRKRRMSNVSAKLSNVNAIFRILSTH